MNSLTKSLYSQLLDPDFSFSNPTALSFHPVIADFYGV